MRTRRGLERQPSLVSGPHSEVWSNQEGAREKPVPRQAGCAQTPTTVPSPACRLSGREPNH